jgi:hypothetical protein
MSGEGKAVSAVKEIFLVHSNRKLDAAVSRKFYCVQ